MSTTSPRWTARLAFPTLLGTLFLMSACNTGIGGAPVAGGSASPGVTTTAGGTPTPPGGEFREEFEGTLLDPERWLSFDRGGVTVVHNGVVDMLTTSNQTNFPDLVSKLDIIPQAGPWSFEVGYKIPTVGPSSASFSLDYLPPTNAEDGGLTQPFMRTLGVEGDLVVVFNLESGEKSVKVPGGNVPNKDLQLRVECDDKNSYRLLAGAVEVTTFTSKRRPRKFWIGAYPKPSGNPVNWSRYNIDYVAVQVIYTPAAATPLAAAPGG